MRGRRDRRRRMAPVRDKVSVLREAVALEEAGSTWRQWHAAAVAGCSVSFLRESDCPKQFEEGHGPKGKLQVVYEPVDVRRWKGQRRRRSNVRGDQ